MLDSPAENSLRIAVNTSPSATVAVFLSWVDYSSAERQRMRQAVALFSEKATRDELGIGIIRDAISDALFPGTSVIQTRLRYVLFIPWIYQALEKNHRVHAGNVDGFARTAQLALIDPLLKADDSMGVIGRLARGSLQRLPSSVYWLALGRWGILRRQGSLDDYHRSWDRMKNGSHSTLAPDDRGVAIDGTSTWNLHLPPQPESLPASATFALTRHEAEFVQERIRVSCPDTLLAHAADAEASARPPLDWETPWESFTADVPAALTRRLVAARKFAVLMHGAAFTYNLALARRSDAFALAAAQHEAALAAWADDAASHGVGHWELDELWLAVAGANVTERTRAFVTEWQRLFRQRGARVGDDSEAARLVEQREWQLKGSRSRFRNPRALEVWGGNSGTALMTYRWGTVRQLLADLYAGLARLDD